jgi:pimeloyl-ACP methyl ester carboxylesterase
MTAMLAANSSKTVEFLILLGSPTIDLSDVFLTQYENVYLCLNSSDEIKIYKTYSYESYNLVKTINDSKELTEELLKLELKIFNRTNVIEEDVIEFLNLQWVKDGLLFKSEEVLKNIKIPVLGLYGSLDLYVSPNENADLLNKSLSLGGNTNYKIKIIPNLNHQFQTATTGHHLEYYSIDETIAPEVLNELSDFIKEMPTILNKTES